MIDFSDLKFENLINDVNTIRIDKDNSYIISYPYFIRYFNNLRAVNEESFIQGTHMIYGWMPKVLNLNIIEGYGTYHPIELVNKVKNGQELEALELLKLKRVVNNSVVGVSKLLHFINPNLYAIWDSTICQIYKKTNVNAEVNNIDNYLEYNQRVRQIIRHEHFDDLKVPIEKQLGYRVSAIRAVELFLWQKAKIQNNPNEVIFYEHAGHHFRGDDFLWADFKRSMLKKQFDSVEVLITTAHKVFEELTGYSIEENEPIFLEKYEYGGMSGGQIGPKFWREDIIPKLAERYRSINLVD